MRVVCIDDSEQWFPPFIKKGNVYHVIESNYRKYEEDDEYIYQSGIYLTLMETGDEGEYHESCFIPINENQQDEQEILEERADVLKETILINN